MNLLFSRSGGIKLFMQLARVGSVVSNPQDPSGDGLILGESSVTAYRGDRGKAAYDHCQSAHAPADANNYVHPANHPASVITQDTNNRFVSDAEKAAWNAKQAALVSGSNLKTVNGATLLGSGDVSIPGGGGVSLGETSDTAYRGDRGKAAYDHAQTAHAPSDANNYVHPANHAASVITQDSSNRFVSDAEKAAWNAKQAALVSGTNLKTVNGTTLLGSGDVTLPTGVALGESSVTAYRGDRGKAAYDHSQTAHAPADANNYVHPANHAPSVITQDANNRFVSDAEKAAWNAKQAALVSGTNIKTVNGTTLLGSGDVTISGGAKAVKTPVRIAQADDLSANNAQFESGSNIVDSTVTIDTTNKEFTVTPGAGGYTKSCKTHRNLTYGRNIILNVISKSASNYPQVQFRGNAKDTIGMELCYRNNATTLAIQRVTNTSGGTEVLVNNIPLDGSFSGELNISARAYNDLIEIVAMSGGYVVGLCRHISTQFDENTGRVNGLGAFNTCVYKGPLFAQLLDNYFNIVCLGDSNTAGNGLTAKQTYPNQVQAKFFEWNVGAINKGVSGDTVASVIARLTSDVYTNKVKDARNIVVLQIGTNDIGNSGIAPSVVYDNIVTNLIPPLQSNGFEVWLCTVPYRSDNAGHLANVKTLNTLIRANTTAEKVIDVYDQMVDEADALIPGLLQGDGIHLTEKMNRFWASLVADNLYKV
jgi:lysophospholipase L1-like esterase